MINCTYCGQEIISSMGCTRDGCPREGMRLPCSNCTALQSRLTRAMEIIAECERALEFTLHCAEYVVRPDEPVIQHGNPMFYLTATYDGDLEVVEKTKKARAALELVRGFKKEGSNG